MKGCVGANPQTECLVKGYPLLSGRLQLNGGWTLKPIEILNGDAKPGVEDRSVWGFHTTGNRPKPHFFQGVFASGFLFEITVDKISAVTVMDNGSAVSLTQASQSECLGFDDSAPNCTVILVRNLPPPSMGAVEDDDKDFELFYVLLEKPQAERHIPTLLMKHVNPFGPGNPPGSKCFGTFLEPGI
jgi:hypothetical protein